MARLTPSCATIMSRLMRAAGKPVRKELLLDDLWHNRPDGPGVKIIDVHIWRLRKILSALESAVTIPFNRRGPNGGTMPFRLHVDGATPPVVTVSMLRADFDLLMASRNSLARVAPFVAAAIGNWR